ncbi:MAG: antibiotic biosynthesis monooxygenase [Chloroflexi bacterium]|nr:antibiotic biosynthesis monooxygenase [Chloroflexota bacterium]
MYVHHEVYRVNQGWQRELEGRVPRLHAMQAKAPGFVSAHFLRHMGDLTTYLALRAWESREAAQAYSRTPEFQEYLRSRPPEAYAQPPEIEYYELVVETQGQGEARFAYRLEFDVAQGRAWEERERQLHGLLQQARGFHSARALRFLGNPNRFLRVALWQGRDAIVDFLESDALKGYRAAAPEGLLRSPTQTRFYEVLGATTPA